MALTISTTIWVELIVLNQRLKPHRFSENADDVLEYVNVWCMEKHLSVPGQTYEQLAYSININPSEYFPCVLSNSKILPGQVSYKDFPPNQTRIIFLSKSADYYYPNTDEYLIAPNRQNIYKSVDRNTIKTYPIILSDGTVFRDLHYVFGGR